MVDCPLCRQSVDALVDSHIVPQSFYRTWGKPGNAGMIVCAGQHPKRSRTGIYDQFLCANCEGKFDIWDDYACSLLRDTEPDEICQNYFAYDCVDYVLLKLFFLSVIWRAHACSLATAVFGDFTLDSSLSDRLREIILKRVAPPAEELSVFVAKSNQKIAYLLGSPAVVAVDAVQFLRLYIPGYVIFVKIEQGPIPRQFLPFLLYPGTGFTTWHYDFMAGGEAGKAAEVYRSVIAQRREVKP